MKLTLTKPSNDGNYRDLPIAQIGVNCPYAIEIRWRRYWLTAYRWNYLTLCIAKQNSDANRGGAHENWAEWVLWNDRPWGRLQFWRAPKQAVLKPSF